MLLNLSHTGLGKLQFIAANSSSDPRPWLSGANFVYANVFLGKLSIQDKEHERFGISLRKYSFSKTVDLAVKESTTGIRLEIMLSGELVIQSKSGNALLLREGSYWLNYHDEYFIQTNESKQAALLVIFLKGLPGEYTESPLYLVNDRTYLVSPEIRSRVTNLLDHGLTASLLDLFYENTIREIFFFHLKEQATPGEDDEKRYLQKILEVDAIISKDLQEHFSISQLSRMAGLSTTTLKQQFRDHFNMGIFERLTQKRFEKATELLACSNLSIRDISFETGYQNLSSFIKAFRRNFNLSPREWRQQNQAVR